MGNLCCSGRREEAVSVSKEEPGKGLELEVEEPRSLEAEEAVYSKSSAEQLQQISAGATSDNGSGRSTEDSFNMSHVVPNVEGRVGPKLDRVTPFPLDRTSPKTGTSSANEKKLSTLSAFTEEAE